ncbi:hypothetical protein MHBO_003246 [Bonamia ostreae]|uniref:Uncharacterized protein n=1 Tax=Bonamia ostreae TaxID=126728 RepID=A0ABV2APW7_9EUKA
MVEVKNCLQESQKNFSSHPQFITEIRAQHKDPKPFLKDLFRYLKRIFFIEKQTVPLKRVLKFVARIATFPTTDHNGRNWVDVYSSGLILFKNLHFN